MRLRLLFFLILTAHSVLAQRYSFFQRGVEDGLINPVINDILEDETGMIWLATDGGGLVRFDGNNFQSFDVFDNLPSPFITVLVKDENGSFWIGTEKGVAFYDGLNLTIFGDGPSARINAISISEKGIWIASREGLHLFNKGKFVLQNISEEREVLSVANFENITYYCTAKGAFSLEEASATPMNIGPVNKIIRLKKGVLFSSAEQALCQLSDSVFIIDIPGVRDAVLTENGTLWLASQRNGLIRLRNGTPEIIDANHGLAYDRVRSLLYKDGKLLVGSQQGLAFFQNPETFVLDASQGIENESVHAALMVDDAYWLGTAAGISIFKTDGSVENYGPESGLPEGIVLDIERYENKIWVATEKGVAYFKNKKFIPLAGNDDFMFCLENAKNGLYIGTATGVLRFAKGRIEQLNFADNIPDGIVDITFGQRGQNFLGLSGAIYENSPAGLKQLKTWNNLLLDTLSVFAIKSSPNNEALLINGFGIYFWNGKKVFKIDEHNGLLSANFKSAAFVGERLWLVTDLGMQFIDLSADENRPFTIGSISDYSFINQRDFNSRALSVTADHKILNGSNNGLFVIDDASIKSVPNIGVSIVDVNLFFKNGTNWAEFTNALARWSNLPQKLALPYDQNYLSFTFDVAPFFAYDAKTFMRFKLVGQDKNWTNAGERREAFFTNISAGSYTFEVESSLTPNFETVRKASFSFKIVPPFWRTWWFWALVVFSVGAIIVVSVRYRLQQVNQKLALEAALAESERKALRLQMNPHFVFNALDAISGFIFKNEAKEAVRYLGSFAKLMRITLESSRETLVPVHNEIQLLKNYIDLEQLRFNNRFAYEIIVDDEVDVYDAQLPPMLLQPFVENAILHGLRNKEGDQGLLKITFEEADDHLVCTIEDNGIGREKSAELNKGRTKKSLATSITEERINLLSKSLGERVTFSISDLKNEAGEAAGTKVVITFPHLVADE